MFSVGWRGARRRMSSSLAFPQTVTLHFKHVSSVQVHKFALDEDLSKVTVTFRLQADKTHAYREYTVSYVATLEMIARGEAAMVARAYEQAWAAHHADMLAFVNAEAVKPRWDERVNVP